jgi:hypothetical protein
MKASQFCAEFAIALSFDLAGAMNEGLAFCKKWAKGMNHFQPRWTGITLNQMPRGRTPAW